MSKNLVEHIIDGDYVEASEMFTDRLNDIMEMKLYEMKRSIDLTENAKEVWAKYRKDNPSLTFHGTPANPRAKAPAEKKERTSTGVLTKHGIEARRKRGYLQAHPALKGLEFIEKVAKYKETGKLGESNQPKDQKYVAGTNPIVDRALSAERRARASKATQDLQKTKSKQPNTSSDFISKMSQAGKDASKYKLGPDVRQGMSQAGQAAAAEKAATKKANRSKIINKARNIAGAVMNSPWEVTHSESVVNEVINAQTPVKSVIRDFVYSKNKTFKGDSKKKRIKRALGAYYAMHEAKAWKDISAEAKKHPFGKSQNNVFTKRKRKRKIVKKIFNEE